MPFRNASKPLTLATLLTLAACSGTNCNLPAPPADVMQPPEVTDFLTPISDYLGLEPPQNGKPAN